MQSTEGLFKKATNVDVSSNPALVKIFIIFCVINTIVLSSISINNYVHSPGTDKPLTTNLIYSVISLLLFLAIFLYQLYKVFVKR